MIQHELPFYVVKTHITLNELINKAQSKDFNFEKKSSVIKSRSGSFLNSIKLNHLLPNNKWTLACEQNFLFIVRVLLLLLLKHFNLFEAFKRKGVFVLILDQLYRPNPPTPKVPTRFRSFNWT